MKLREIRELSAADLGKKSAELKRELGVEKGSATGGTKSSGKMRNLRRIIAKMLCIKREKELGIHQPKAPEKAKAGASAESASKSSNKK